MARVVHGISSIAPGGIMRVRPFVRGSFAFTLTALAATLAACGDATPLTSAPGTETSVLLTDAPFPYDSVTRVDVFIERIEASTSGDTTGNSGSWVTVAEPKRTFNLLDLQNGQT